MDNTHRRAQAELCGTALLLAVVVGSGIMGERLDGGNTAVALLANSIATGGGLAALISLSGQLPERISILWSRSPWWKPGRHSKSDISIYVISQVAGGIWGV